MAKAKVFYFLNYPFRMTGANQVLFNLLQSRKESSVVIFMFDGPASQYFADNGISVHSLGYRPKWIGSFGKNIFKIRWYQVLTELIPEIVVLNIKLFRFTRSANELKMFRAVHFNDTRGLLTAGWFFKFFGYHVVTHIHGEFDGNNVKGIRWRLSKFLSNRFITVSNYLRDRMDDQAKAKAVNIYNGLSGSYGDGIVPHLRSLMTRNVRILLKVASIVPFKGIHVLIEAVHLLSPALRSNLLFVIAGPEPQEYRAYQDFLRRQIISYGLEDSFLFAGWQSDLSPFYNSCDMLVHSSISFGSLRFNGHSIEIQGNEGLPTCILEAMRSSVPVIASRISGIPEQVEDQFNGLLVEPNDARALASAIERMTTSSPLLVSNYKMNARAVFQSRFQLAQFIDSIEKVYGGVRR